MNVDVSGTNEVIEYLKKKAEPTNTTSAMNEAIALVERYAKEKAPSSSGELRSSIASEIVSGSNTEVVGRVYTPLTYGLYVEYGTGLFASAGRKDVPWHYQKADGEWVTTSGQKPQPFLIPALNENRDSIIQILKGGIVNG